MLPDKEKIRAQAQKFVQKGQLDRAVKEFERLAKDDPQDLRTPLKIGDLQVRLGDTPQAIQTFSAVAETYYGQGAWPKAIALYKQIFKLDPNCLPASRRLVELYIKLGLNSDALVQLGHLVGVLEAVRQYPEAESVLAQRIAIEGPTAGNLMRRAEIAFAQSDLTRAHDALRQVVAAERSPLRPLEWVTFYERAADLGLPDASLHVELARYYLTQKDLSRALVRLQTAFRTQPESREVLTLLARVFEELGDVERAIATLRELAVHERRARDHAAWERTLQHLLTLNPNDQEAKEWLDSDNSRVVAIPQQVLRTQSLPGLVQEPLSPDDFPLFATEVEADDTGALTLSGEPVLGEPTTYDLSSEEVTEQLMLEAVSFARVGLRDQATLQLRAILTQHPGHRAARHFLAELRQAAGHPEEAAAQYTLLAEQETHHGDRAAAVNALQAALTAWPTHPEAHQRLTELRGFTPRATPEERREDEKSEETLDSVLHSLQALAPEEAQLDVSTAEAGWDAIEEEPELAEAHFFIAQGLFEDAHDELEGILARDPVHPGALALRQIVEQAIETPDAVHPAKDAEASEPWERVAMWPSVPEPTPVVASAVNVPLSLDTETHMTLGLACREMGLFQEAIREFALAALDPAQAPRAEVLMGLCHLQDGQSEKAVEILAHAVLRQPRDSSGLAQLRLEVGTALLAAGRPWEARRFFERASLDAPDLTQAKARLEEAETLISDFTGTQKPDPLLDALLEQQWPDPKAVTVNVGE